MIAYKTSPDALRRALEITNQHYAGNLEFTYTPRPENRAATTMRFTLRVRSSRGPGARRSHSGRRLVAACWHAHRDFMRALYAICPEMRLKTALATYEGRADFERKFMGTGERNIGSMMQPCAMDTACDCEDVTAPALDLETV